MTRSSYRYFALAIAATLLPALVSAAPRVHLRNNSCAVTGIVPLKQYVLPSDRQCFSSSAKAAARGYVFFGSNPPRRFRNAATCNFIGLRATKTYYSLREMKCFRSRSIAERRHYTRFLAATPTPVAAPGGTMPYDPPPNAPAPAGTPTPTPPAAAGQAVDYPNIALWHNETDANGHTTGYQIGTCSATLFADHTTLKIGCTYDYPNVTELHLHLPPDNTEYCPAPNPASPVAPYTCTLPADIAQGIIDGKVFVMIHSGPIGEGVMITAAGYF